MTVIVGIDPGSRITGYGVIRWQDNAAHYVDSGAIRAVSGSVQARLQQIYREICSVVTQHKPDEAAIEQIFMHQNPGAALKLGQARGVAMVALALPVAEYSARQVKQSVAGYGAAAKVQIQHMVKILLKLPKVLQADEADALAIAICHAHMRYSVHPCGAAPRARRRSSSWRAFCPQ